MPAIQGILESALYVADLDRAEAFYTGLFGFRRLLADERLRALAVAEKHVLLLFKKGGSADGEATPGGKIPGHDAAGQQHLAFSIDRSDVEAWQALLTEKSVPIESHVRPEQGGHSLYFRDPDGHLIELVTPGVWAIH